WVDQFDWKARAAEWDREQQRLEEAIWHERQAKVRDRAWSISEKMLERAEQMLALPLIEQVTEKDGKTVIIRPARWTMDSIPRMVTAAQDLAKLSQGMDLKRLLDEIEAMDDDTLIAQTKDVVETHGAAGGPHPG